MSKELVLIVEDDAITRTTLMLALKRAGFGVIECDCGRAAMQRSWDELPHAAVIDYRLGDVSGSEVSEFLARDLLVPCLFLTAYGDDAVINAAASSGAMGFLVKPVDPRQVVATLQMLVRRAKDMRSFREQHNTITENITARQDIGTAAGMLMERNRISYPAAFETLRRYARSQQRRMADVAREMLLANEVLNAPCAVASGTKAGRLTSGRGEPRPSRLPGE